MSINFAPTASKINSQFLITKDLIRVLLFLFAFPLISSAQVGINTTVIDPSAILQVESTDKGVLFPGLTDVQMRGISSPANGLMVYCTDCCVDGAGAPYYYDGDWKSLVSNCEIQIAPSCVDIDITVENSNHMNTGNAEVDLIDGNTDGNQGGLYKMHGFSTDQVKVEFPDFIIPTGYSVELFFEYGNNDRTIGIKADFIYNGITYGTIDTTVPIPPLPTGATIVASGGGIRNYTLTYLLPQSTDELFITATGEHPYLYEIKVLDQLGVPINMKLSCL